MADWDAYFAGSDAKKVGINWDNYFGGETLAPQEAPTEFASGTKARMAEYQGLSPEQASQKYLKSVGETLDKIGLAVSDPMGTAGKVASAVGGAIAHPIQTAEDIGKYYYQNPDTAATDVALMATPLRTVGKAGEAVGEAGVGLKGQAAAKIESAKAQGRIFPSEAAAPAIKDIRDTLDTMNYDPLTHRRVATALAHVDRLIAKSTTTPEMEQAISSFTGDPKLRAKLRLAIMDKGPLHSFGDIHNALINLRPAIKAGGTEGKMAEMMQEKLDDYAFNLPKGPEFQQGMAEYSQARKLDTINEIKERVENATKGNVTRAGVAHNLAKEFRKIADNPKKLRLWKPDEQQAIKTITRKGNTAQWIAGKIGQFAPTGIGRIGIDVVIGHILGGLIPGGTYGLMAIGGAARGVETALARSRLTQFERLVSSGGDKSVYNTLAGRPRTAQAIRNWANAQPGTATRAATIALTSAISKEVNRPDLQQRIQQELEGIKE